MQSYTRLLAIDPSLTCSGWALFDADGQGLVGVGKIRSLPAQHPLALRLDDLQSKIRVLFDQISLCSNDVLVCESPTTMRDPRAALKVEQVRGIFETLARARGITVPGRLNPRSVQYEVMGLKGKQLARSVIKEMAVRVVQQLYGAKLDAIGFKSEAAALARHQDIVDAILVGSLALTRMKTAQVADLSLEQVFRERAQTRRIRIRSAACIE